MAGDLGDRHLEGDRVHVEALERVHPGRVGAGDQVQVLEGAQRSQVEDAAEVDMERVRALPGEDPATPDLVHGRGSQVGVVRRRPGADVDRRAGQPGGEHLGLAVLDPGERVELRPVPAGAVETRDLAGVVEEGLRVAHHGVELEAVGDVGLGLAPVGDVDVVDHVVAELVEVRPAVRGLERDVVGDQRDGVGPVGADERVDVRAVGDGVLGGLGCFAVGRHLTGLPLR